MLRLSRFLPFCKLPLTFFTFVKSQDVWQNTAGDCFDLVGWDRGAGKLLFSFSQVIPPWCFIQLSRCSVFNQISIVVVYVMLSCILGKLIIALCGVSVKKLAGWVQLLRKQ